MPQISIRPGDSLTIGEDTTIKFEGFLDGCSHLKVDDSIHEVSVVRGPEPEPEPEATEEEIQARLWKLSSEITNGLSKLRLNKRKEFVGALVGEIFYSAAAQDSSEQRRQRQKEKIAAAKERGVRFGPAPKPLPDNFDECYEQWRRGEMGMREAAEACGMPKSSFRRAAVRKEQADA